MKRIPTARPAKELEAKIGYTFSDFSLLTCALTHPSLSNEVQNGKHPLPHYEQLEFLGDAVLSFVVADFLYHHFSDVAEGILSAARKSVVERKALSAYADRLDLGDYILFGNGAQRHRNNASTLENVFEALIGAIYRDGGIEAAKQFILSFMEADLHAIVPSLLRTGGATDAKTILQQAIQSDGALHTIVYEIIDRQGPDHDPTFTAVVRIDNNVFGQGCGSSKRMAEEAAAQQALQYFPV